MSRNRYLRRAMVWIGTSLFVAFATSVAFSQSKPTTAGADPTDPEQVALGRKVYQQNCASCHGAKLEGQPNWRVRKKDGRLPAPPHDESGHTWHHPDEHLFRITKNGKKPPLAPIGYESDMLGYDGVLSDREIWAVLSFIKNSWPSKNRAFQNRMNRAYQQ